MIEARKINYSIIIPTRNQTDLLRRCLNSIPHRDDIQIIVVDDNSDPRKVDFDSYPGLDDPYTEVIFTKEGKGAGYARNCGLRVAKGKWILFADSDDVFFTRSLNYKMDFYTESGVDIVFFKVQQLFVDTGVINRDFFYSNIIEQDDENAKLQLRYNVHNPWGKFIKRSLIDSYCIRFSECAVCNDAYFSLQSGHYAKDVLIDKDIIYTWCFRTDGNITSRVDLNSTYIRYGQALLGNKFLRGVGKVEWSTNLFSYYRLFRMGGKTPCKIICKFMNDTLPGYKMKNLVAAFPDILRAELKLFYNGLKK